MVARLVIAGTASGVGKTTVTVALARALRARGMTVAVCKCGPDYLDPSYHVRATGGACESLDGWMMGKDAVLSTFAHATRGADIALIEGVMGLYDGASPTGDAGSTAEIAKWLAAPVLLVCDASGMARSIAALASGFAAFDRELAVAGVIANRLGSRGHLQLLRAACDAPRILGGLPKEPELAFPERHLGLVTADRAVVPDALLDGWGARAAEWLDLDALLAAAWAAPALAPPPALAAAPTAPACRIGVALDDAFHFYYADNLRRLEQLGAELVRFSPIRDAALPDVDGLYLGGGYPELHAGPLAANTAMREAIAAFAAAGGPIYAECGGLMYLSRGIRTLDGALHPMVGLVPGHAEMRDRRVALGYVEVEVGSPSVLGEPGLRFRGHEFRYSDLALTGEVDQVYTVRRRRGGEVRREGYRVGSVLASYVHAHWASNPLAARGLVAACTAHRRRPS